MEPQFHDFQYLHLADTVLDTGAKKQNRTGISTVSTFSNQMRFNISDGTIPLLTTKKMYLPAIIRELVDWYLTGDSSAYNLQKKGVRIWNEWADEDGLLGPVYGHLWRGWPANDATSITPVKDRTDYGTDLPFVYTAPNHPVPKSEMAGINQGGEKYTIQVLKVDGKTKYQVTFDDTGYTMFVKKHQLHSGSFRDPYAMSELGVACIGEKTYTPSFRKRAYGLWRNMLLDVYGYNNPMSNEGYFVDTPWRCFANFLEDLPKIPGFYNWLNGNWESNSERMELTSQYYSSLCYGVRTCVFVPASMIWKETRELSGSKIGIKATRGKRTIFDFNVDRLAKKTGVEANVIMREVHNPAHRILDSGWVFEVVSAPLGHTFRQTLYIDQIARVIDLLKTNPDDRRMLVTAWNPGLLDEMQLPPCHYTFQFYTRPLTIKERMDIYVERTKDTRIYDDYYTWDGTICWDKMDKAKIPERALSCMMNQRSADVFLGVPFNIAQYSILTHMIAQVVNMQPDEFIWNGGDTHIYSNHEAQTLEQFTREPFASPKVSLNKLVDKIDNFTYDDIIIEGYESHGQLKAQVAV